MSTDIELLAKKVEKHQAKLQEHTTLLEMTEKRAATADQDRQGAAREADRLKKRAKQAKQEARRLAREAKRAHLRLEAGEADHDQAEKERLELGKLVEKRRDKLAKAEAAHAAAQAGQRATGTAPRTRTSSSRKTASPRRTASSATSKRTSTAAKKTTTRRTTRRAPTKK